MSQGAPEHHVVYREKGRFAGWPANYGMWAWGNELVVIFAEGAFLPGIEGHKRDKSQPARTLQARSLDGGQHWDVRPIPCRIPGDRSLSADEHQIPRLQIGDPRGGANPPVPFSGEVDFTASGLAILCARTGLHAGASSWFYVSHDRAVSWKGPYALPDFGQPGISARTDWVALGPRHALFLLTAVKSDGREGRVLCAETVDGGRSFHLKSWVGPEPEGYAIMPSTVRLSEGSLLTAVRLHGGKESARPWGWIDLYRSDDLGASWRLTRTVVPATGAWSNPPAMIRLRDGRIVLVYGNRDRPSSIRALVSDDAGESWGDEIVLRDGGGDEDIGYPRVVERADGRLVTAYYWDEAPDAERSIEATVFKPEGR